MRSRFLLAVALALAAAPIVAPASDVEIRGVVIAVLRRYR